MNSIPGEEFNNLSDSGICRLFGKVNGLDETKLKIHIAARDVNYLLDHVNKLKDDTDSAIYLLMSTMVDFDNLWGNKYSDSPIKKYQKLWTRSDLYYMFMHGYHQLRLRRTISIDDECQLISLFSLLSVSPIPSIEEV